MAILNTGPGIVLLDQNNSLVFGHESGFDYDSLTSRKHLFTVMDNDDNYDYYIIHFAHPSALEYLNIHDLIPQPILDRVADIEDNTMLLFTNTHESMESVPMHVYNFIERYNLPDSKCIIMSGANNILDLVNNYASKFNLRALKTAKVVAFEDYMKKESVYHLEEYLSARKHENYLSYVPKKRFLSLNRRWRNYRPCVVSLLCAFNLLDNGYVSIAENDDGNKWEDFWNNTFEFGQHNRTVKEILINNEEKIRSLPELFLDIKDLSINQSNLQTSINDYYLDSLFSVVSETNFLSSTVLYDKVPDPGFFSEKTFKPIVYMHPFILVTTPNQLPYLRELGYKTFSPLINESYDTIEDDGDRLLAIMDEIQRLSSMTNEEILRFKSECEPILIHNYKTLMNKKHYVHRLNY